MKHGCRRGWLPAKRTLQGRNDRLAELIMGRPGLQACEPGSSARAARLTLSLGEAAAWSWPGSPPGMRKADMGLLTIGSFARAARLSPKALRLYDDLGLLRPARVDPLTGYRLYDPCQLEQARLVAWLRRIGMPLARIRVVCELPAAAAASEVAAYWSLVESDTAARRQLAAFLIDYLSGKDTAMPDARKALGIRYAVRSDVGQLRENNEDAAYAGARLLAVADGLGGQ